MTGTTPSNKQLIAAARSGDLEQLRRHAGRLLDPPHPHQVRARAIAEALGPVELTTSSVDEKGTALARGFFVPDAPALGGRPIGIGVSAVCPTLVLISGIPQRGLSTAVIAKTLAHTETAKLRSGESICPAAALYGRDVDVGGFPARWELVEPARVASTLRVEDAVFARPLPGRTIAAQRELELLDRCAARMRRLVELAAPSIIIEKDQQNISEAWARLAGLGWTAEEDPLPAALMETIGPLVASTRTSRKKPRGLRTT